MPNPWHSRGIVLNLVSRDLLSRKTFAVPDPQPIERAKNSEMNILKLAQSFSNDLILILCLMIDSIALST